MTKRDNDYKKQYHREYMREYAKKWRYTVKAKAIKKRYIESHPWVKTYNQILGRCKHSPNYNGEIKLRKNFLTIKDLKYLWFRDKAYLMKKPSIDRIDNDGHYTLENCRYIELNENVHRYHFNRGKSVKQLSLKGKVIKIWNCIRSIERKLGIDHTNISHTCGGHRKTAGGYKWEYVY